MELSTFYAVLSGACLALVGLWWSVLDRRPALLGDPARRRASGGVLLTFLLPGLMALFAQIGPTQPWIWRTTFVLAGLLGAWSAWRLAALQSLLARGLWWLVLALHLLVVLVGLAPAVMSPLGLTPLQSAAVALVCLVATGHALAWLLLSVRSVDPPEPSDL